MATATIMTTQYWPASGLLGPAASGFGAPLPPEVGSVACAVLLVMVPVPPAWVALPDAVLVTVKMAKADWLEVDIEAVTASAALVFVQCEVVDEKEGTASVEADGKAVIVTRTVDSSETTVVMVVTIAVVTETVVMGVVEWEEVAGTTVMYWVTVGGKPGMQP